jgi:hypothetical protein
VHSAPDAAGYWTTLLRDPRQKQYTELLKVWMYEAGAKALSNMQPARMKTITTTHYSCYDRKTMEFKKDPNCHLPMIRDVYDGPDGDSYDWPLIQTDKRDPVVRNTQITAAQFISEQDGSTIATFINWHNHPDSLRDGNMMISSDYAHYLRKYVEHELGGTAVYFTGTLGCQIGEQPKVPAPLWDENYQRVYEGGKPVLTRTGWDKIRSTGYEIGHEVVEALRQEGESDRDVPVDVRTESIDTPVDNVLHMIGTESVWKDDVEHPDRMRWSLGRCSRGFGCVRSDLSLIKIGELSILTAPGEVDPSYWLGRGESQADYGKKFGKKRFPAMPSIKRYMPGRHQAILGQANNYLSYLLHRPDNVGALNFNHPIWYEEFVTISPSFGDLVGDRLMKMLMSPERFSVKTNPTDPIPEWKGSVTDLLQKMERTPHE